MTMLLDQLVAVLLLESPRHRKLWLAAHARAVRPQGRERPPPMPPRWVTATVCGGRVAYHTQPRRPS